MTEQIYVDKTEYFHRLVTDPCRRYFFCARPRRFGKSLGDVPRAECIRDRLATIYAQFKDNMDKIRFLMCWGFLSF